MLKIDSIELIEINLPLVHFFETSFGRTYERRIILVRVADGDGAEGWGEITCGETPGYSDEWTDSAWVTAEKILAPIVVGKEVASAADIWGADAMGSRPSDGKIRHRNGLLGPRGKKTWRSAVATPWRRESGNRMRCVDRHSGQRRAAFRERSESRSRPVTNASRSRSNRAGITT